MKESENEAVIIDEQERPESGRDTKVLIQKELEVIPALPPEDIFKTEKNYE